MEYLNNRAYNKRAVNSAFCIPPSPRLWRTSLRSAFSSGFSLVEVSLALLIVGVAMLAILGMFPTGLEQNARSISDTHSAFFAEEIFSALRVHSETNWHRIGNDGVYAITSVVAAASNNWFEPENLRDWLNNEVRTNLYCHPDNPSIVDHSFRYRASLRTNGAIKELTLRVWPGQFGTTNNPTFFYSEFYRMNR